MNYSESKSVSMMHEDGNGWQTDICVTTVFDNFAHQMIINVRSLGVIHICVDRNSKKWNISVTGCEPYTLDAVTPEGDYTFLLNDCIFDDATDTPVVEWLSEDSHREAGVTLSRWVDIAMDIHIATLLEEFHRKVF